MVIGAHTNNASHLCSAVTRALGQTRAGIAAASFGIAMCLSVPAGAAPGFDLNGVWERYPNPISTNADVFEDLRAPEGGPALREPYASEWKALLAKRDAASKAGKPLVDDSTKCRPEGMPGIMGAIFPIEILQTPGRITVLGEFLTQTRRIFLDTQMLTSDDYALSYYGFSTGRWMGDTLVITTKHVRPDVQFFEIPHSEAMTITERIRSLTPDMIENQVEIDDPTYLKQPYRFTFGYKRNRTYRIMEYFCDKSSDVVEEDGTVSMKVNPASH
ncbi:MAG: hypothetical protein ABI395_10570 [Sphingobium sp.]